MTAIKVCLLSLLLSVSSGQRLDCSEIQIVKDENIYWPHPEIYPVGPIHYSSPLCINDKGFPHARRCDEKTGEYVTEQIECRSLQWTDGCMEGLHYNVNQNFCYKLSDTVQKYNDSMQCQYNRVLSSPHKEWYEYLSNEHPIWLPWRRNDVNGGIGDFVSTALTLDYLRQRTMVDFLEVVSGSEDVQHQTCLSLHKGNYSTDCKLLRYHVCLQESIALLEGSSDDENEPDFCQKKHENDECMTSWKSGLDGVTCICPTLCQTPSMHPVSKRTPCGIGLEVNKEGVLVWSATKEPVNNTLWKGSIPESHESHPKFFVWDQIDIDSGWIYWDEPPNCMLCETHWHIEKPKITLSYDPELTELIVQIENEERMFHRNSLGNEEDFAIFCSSHIDMFTKKQLLATVNKARVLGGVWQCEIFDIADVSESIVSNKVNVHFESFNYLILQITCDKSLAECNTDLETISIVYDLESLTRTNVIVEDGMKKFDQTYRIDFREADGRKFFETMKKTIAYSQLKHLNPRLYSLEFCEEVSVMQNGHEVLFAEALVNDVSISSSDCYDVNGYRVKIQCVGDHSKGARFEAVPECHTFQTSPSTELADLELSDAPPAEIISNLSLILQNKEYFFHSADFNKTANILENVALFVSKEELSQTISHLMEANSTTLHESQTQFNSTDRVLYILDAALASGELEETEKFVETQNIASLLMNIDSEYRGMGLTLGNEMVMLKTHNLEELLQIEEWTMVAYINYTIEDVGTTGTMNTTSITLFHSPVLFNEPSNATASDHQVYQKVFGVLIPEYFFLQTNIEIVIVFPSSPDTEEICAFWFYGQHTSGRWKADTDSTQLENYTICTFNHTTHFGQLLMAQTILNPLSDWILSMITLIECSFSCLGIFLIFLTAFVFPSWGLTHLRMLNYCLVLLMQIVLLVVSTNLGEDVSGEQTGCLVIGACLHFAVLSHLCWMVVLAERQYRMFVVVFHTRTINTKWVMTFTYGLPLTIVSITLGVDVHTYTENSLKGISLCYPSGNALIYALLVPGVMAMICNGGIYARIIYVVYFRQENRTAAAGIKDTDLLLKLRLFGQLFFTLGITWWLGVLAFLLKSEVFLYLFSITTSMQGFVVFLFIIVANKKVRQMYANKIEKLKSLMF